MIYSFLTDIFLEFILFLSGIYYITLICFYYFLCFLFSFFVLLYLSLLRYGDLYTEQNVAISGIHTHAGPGGYLQYVVYIVTSLGFVRQSFEVIVDGIEKSIIQAHENLRPGSIFVNKGKETES